MGQEPASHTNTHPHRFLANTRIFYLRSKGAADTLAGESHWSRDRNEIKTREPMRPKD